MIRPKAHADLRRFRCGALAAVILGVIGTFALVPADEGSTTMPVPEAQPSTDAAPAASDKPRHKAAILDFNGEITDIMASSMRRRIDEAKASGVDVIVLDMDTPGGLVSSAISIADMLRELTDIKTVAWVNPNAHSGGSLVAVACDEIVMSRSSRIGDSEVIMGGPTGAGAVPEELHAKAFTPVLADFRQSAKKNGYSQVLCESFVLPEREVWWIQNKETGERRFVFRDEKIRLVGDEEGAASAKSSDAKSDSAKKDDKVADASSVKDVPHDWELVKSYHDVVAGTELKVVQPIVPSTQLLEMSAGEATAYGFCKAIIPSVSALKEHYQIASVIRLAPTWSEHFATFLTSMYVRGFLMLIVLLGAYVEFHTPGVGVPGLVALICLGIFVAGPYAAGLANVWEIILIVLGLLLLALEVFVIPGFGIAGISGLVLVFVGLLGTFVPMEPGHSFPIYIPSMPETVRYLQGGLMTMAASLVMSLIGMAMLSKYLPRTALFQRIAPPNPTPSDVLTEDPYRGAARVGDIGEAQTVLRPSGKAMFGPVLVDVVSRGEVIEPPAKLEVVERRGNRVVVRKALKES